MARKNVKGEESWRTKTRRRIGGVVEVVRERCHEVRA